MQNFLKKSLLCVSCLTALVLSVTETRAHAKTGTVVFLHGSACSGKTSICHELARHSGWCLVNEDDICREQAATRWQTMFPQEFSIIASAIDKENILHAVMRNQILFRAEASQELRLAAKQAINTIQEQLNNQPIGQDWGDSKIWSNMLRAQITQAIINLAQTNNVIVDTVWFLHREHIEQIEQHYHVIHVLIYCPFAEMVKRTIKRNSDALINGKDISACRFFNQTLTSFDRSCQISENPAGAIDTVTRSAIAHGCDIASLCVTESPCATGATKPFTRGEFSPQEFDEFRRNLLANFKSDTAYVHSQLKTEIVIRTDQKTPAESAQLVIDLVDTKRAAA